VHQGFVEAAIRHQEATGVWLDGGLVGASLVQAPGQYPTRLVAKAWQAAGIATTGPAAIARFLRLDRYLARTHLREPHYYLFVLGIDPPMQGRGLGKKLLAALAANADARRLPTYLETDKETSVRLYTSAGYEVLTDETIPGVGFRMWTMRRAPR
jgi:GNAT superfamily N-acetyltransferase